MAVTPIQNITSGYNTSKINNNFDALQTKVDQVLLGTSDGQNTMYQELDMNSNDIININNLDVNGLSIAGTPVSPTTLGALGPNSVGTAQIIAGAVVDNSITNVTAPKVQFLQAGTSAGLRDVQSKLRDTVCVKDFLCADGMFVQGDGAHDDTTGMQAAHNTGSIVYYPKGVYKFSTLNITQGGIDGDGEAYTYLASTDVGSGNTITFSAVNAQPGANAPLFRHFILTGQAGKTAGSGIYVTAPSAQNEGAQFENIIITGFPVCLTFGAAALWNIQNCTILGFTQYGIWINNTNNPDSGDSTIMGCCITPRVGASAAGINYASSGGLKVLGNKFNGCDYGILLSLNAPLPTSDLLIVGNSIENGNFIAISLNRSSGSATFGNIVINGNQIANFPYGISVDNSGAISDMTISGNIITLGSTGVYGINLASGTRFNIANNLIQGNGGTPVGINIAAACTNGKIGTNNYYNLPATVTNASTSTFITYDIQSGLTNVTTSTAYNTLFSGTAVVTFPVPFTTVPIVVCQSSAGGGGVSAYPTAITTTGFTMQTIGVTNGGVVSNCKWEAKGII